MKTFRLNTIFAVVVFQFLSPLAEAEPRYVDFLGELKSSETVALVRISAYSDEGLVCEALRGSPSRFTFKYSDDPKWKPFVSKDLKQVGTAIWPPVGSSLIVVVGKDKVVSLFALEENDQWRFWSPRMTDSSAMFECLPPSRTIKLVHGQKDKEQYKSWDGCLMPSRELERFYK